MNRVKYWLSQWMALVMVIVLMGTQWVSASHIALEPIDLDQDLVNEAVETPGILRVGMEADYAPFNWSQTSDADGAYPIANSQGEYANGYDVQVALLLADALNLELEIIKTEWDGLPLALQSGKIDAIIAGMTPTPERQEVIDFTGDYYTSEMGIVVLRDGPYADAKGLSDFSGAHITAQMNTFHEDLVQQIPEVQAEQPMDSFPTMISSLLTNKIDGYISENSGAMAAEAANQQLVYISLEPEDAFDLGQIDASLAVGVRLGSPLTDYLNALLEQISPDQHQELMQEMIDLNLKEDAVGFWAEVASVWEDYAPQFMRGAGTTMLIALVTTIIGFIIGLLVAILRTIEVNRKTHPVSYFFYRVMDFLLSVYIEVFRGTPMMVQSMLIFYGSKLFLNIDMSSLTAAFLIVSVNTGAYLSEVIRGGISAVDKGQTEAAKAIGMNHFQTMSLVILPQAIRNILPAIGNEFVINIKDTAVLNVIAVTELFFVTRSAAGSTYLIFQSFFITSVIYFVLTFTTTRIIKLLERYLAGKSSYELVEEGMMTHE